MRPFLMLALAVLVSPGCGGKKTQPPTNKSQNGPARPGPWEKALPPIPSKPSTRFSPRKTLATTRLDKQATHKRLGDLSLAASKEIGAMAGPEEQAKRTAALCRRVAPYVTAEVVDRLAQATFAATQKVKQPDRLQNPYDDLAQCLAHAGAASRARILSAILTRAAKAKDLSVFSFPFRSARSALGKLTPAQVEPILAQAQRVLGRARTYYHREHLLSGMAAAGTVLPAARALTLLIRAERGVSGAAHNESRPVFYGELAYTWVTLAEHHPTLLNRAARAIVRLATTPFRRAKALGKLVDLPTFSKSTQAPAVLKLLRREAAKLPATEKGWLQEKLIERTARVEGALPILRQLVNDADEAHALRARVTATKALAEAHPKDAVGYAGEALDLIDKLPKESRRNWRQAPLFRALEKVDPKVRQPLFARMEKRAAGFKDKYFTVWTLRRLIELQRKSNPGEALRLQKKMMTAVAAIPEPARRVRALRGIFKVHLENGPAAAQKVIAQAVKLSGSGVGAWVWARFIRPLGKRPAAERKRWLPIVLRNIVKQASTWYPDQLARWARIVTRLAPQVMPPAKAEALMLQVWRAVESAEKRSGNVQVRQVVNALRAVGTGLARIGSTHFPTLVRRMLARIPERKAWSEHLMSYVAALGTLLPATDAAQLQKRLEAWVELGGKETRLVRRGAIIAGLVASHGTLDQSAIRGWLAKGEAHLTWSPMVQFLIRLPLDDLRQKAAALPSRLERLGMYQALINATEERAKREPRRRWRRRRRRRRPTTTGSSPGRGAGSPPPTRPSRP